jgi:cell wall-associated NlpC family hydrolase
MIDDWAQELVGVRYNAKGSTPDEGFSCATLCLWCYRQIGLIMSGDSILVWRKYGEFLDASVELQKYDMLVWRAGRLEIATHVGLYIGGGECLHASQDIGQVSLMRINHTSKGYSAVWRPTR